MFAGAYAVVRLAHISLFLNASADDPMLRRSVTGLAISTFIGCALLVAAGLANGTLQGLLGLAALLLDAGGPFLFGSEGWKLVPGHFADLVVLSHDPITTPLEQLTEIEVVATMVGGRWVHNAPPWE